MLKYDQITMTTFYSWILTNLLSNSLSFAGIKLSAVFLGVHTSPIKPYCSWERERRVIWSLLFQPQRLGTLDTWWTKVQNFSASILWQLSDMETWERAIVNTQYFAPKSHGIVHSMHKSNACSSTVSFGWSIMHKSRMVQNYQFSIINLILLQLILLSESSLRNLFSETLEISVLQWFQSQLASEPDQAFDAFRRAGRAHSCWGCEHLGGYLLCHVIRSFD